MVLDNMLVHRIVFGQVKERLLKVCGRMIKNLITSFCVSVIIIEMITIFIVMMSVNTLFCLIPTIMCITLVLTFVVYSELERLENKGGDNEQ